MFSSVNYACASLYQATQLNTAMKDLLTFMEKLDTFVKKLNDVSSDDKKDAVAELRAQLLKETHRTNMEQFLLQGVASQLCRAGLRSHCPAPKRVAQGPDIAPHSEGTDIYSV